MKKQTGMIFFLVALVLTSIAEEPMRSSPNYVNEFGIDLTKIYTEAEINSLFEIIFEEVDVSIDQAFSEGYKAGMLDYEPRAAVLEEKNKALIKESKKKKRIVPWWFIPCAFAVGFVSGELFEALR